MQPPPPPGGQNIATLWFIGKLHFQKTDQYHCKKYFAQIMIDNMKVEGLIGPQIFSFPFIRLVKI